MVPELLKKKGKSHGALGVDTAISPWPQKAHEESAFLQNDPMANAKPISDIMSQRNLQFSCNWVETLPLFISLWWGDIPHRLTLTVLWKMQDATEPILVLIMLMQ
jgi:hypothetical protein